MDNSDLNFVGGIIIATAAFFFFCGDNTAKYWPYCLGAAVFGLALVILSRVLPDQE